MTKYYVYPNECCRSKKCYVYLSKKQALNDFDSDYNITNRKKYVPNYIKEFSETY